MRKIIYLAVVAISLFLFLIPESVNAGILDGFSRSKPSKILNVKKKRVYANSHKRKSRDFQLKVEKIARAPIAYLENSKLADCYRQEPLLFGFLSLFSVLSMGALAFVFHLIRNDPRFY